MLRLEAAVDSPAAVLAAAQDNTCRKSKFYCLTKAFTQIIINLENTSKGDFIMFCKNCGAPIDDGAAICVKCGFQKGAGINFCQHCGEKVDPGAVVCMKCGFALQQQPMYDPATQKSKLTAGLLGIFLGGFGVHNFYLGYTGKAIAQILLSCVGIGAIWGFIEGILILTGNIDKDANGIPLKD